MQYGKIFFFLIMAKKAARSWCDDGWSYIQAIPKNKKKLEAAKEWNCITSIDPKMQNYY